MINLKISPFLRDPLELELWSEAFFISLIKKISL